MIEFITGEIVDINPTETVIETGGIGYQLNISLSTFADIENSKSAKLYVHEAIREDAYTLYGFSTKTERTMFRLLIGVSGVGANTARIILSAIPADELEGVIISGDHRRLTSAKGVGSKTAQRIIVDLKDKIKSTESTLNIQQNRSTDVFDEALAALLMLGFPRQAALKALTKVFKDEPHLKVEVAIKRALVVL